MFCSQCGNDVGEAPFCSNCGKKVGEASTQAEQPKTEWRAAAEERTLWEGIPGGLVDKAKGKLNTVEYRVTTQRVIIRAGLIGKKEVEIEMKHIKDLLVNQSVTDRLTKVGDIILVTTSPSMKNVKLDNVVDPFAVKEIIRKALMDYRANLGINYLEGI